MFCKKQSAIILINIKQTNLLLKTWLRLHSGSRPSLEKSTAAPVLFSKNVKIPAGVYSDTPAPVHLWRRECASSVFSEVRFYNSGE